MVDDGVRLRDVYVSVDVREPRGACLDLRLAEARRALDAGMRCPAGVRSVRAGGVSQGARHRPSSAVTAMTTVLSATSTSTVPSVGSGHGVRNRHTRPTSSIATRLRRDNCDYRYRRGAPLHLLAAGRSVRPEVLAVRIHEIVA